MDPFIVPKRLLCIIPMILIFKLNTPLIDNYFGSYLAVKTNLALDPSFFQLLPYLLPLQQKPGGRKEEEDWEEPRRSSYRGFTTAKDNL